MFFLLSRTNNNTASGDKTNKHPVMGTFPFMENENENTNLEKKNQEGGSLIHYLVVRTDLLSFDILSLIFTYIQS